MKYAFEVGSGAMTYMRSFIKTGSGIQSLKGEGIQRHVDIQTAWRSHKADSIFPK
jgi:hypothetical protein